LKRETRGAKFTEEGSGGGIFMESGMERGTPVAGDNWEMFTGD
jgi:hypothetical protein